MGKWQPIYVVDLVAIAIDSPTTTLVNLIPSLLFVFIYNHTSNQLNQNSVDVIDNSSTGSVWNLPCLHDY